MQIIHNTMQAGGCDLHLHTHHSDGSNSTHQLVDRIIELDCNVFSIRINDTMAAIKEARHILTHCPCQNFKSRFLFPVLSLR